MVTSSHVMDGFAYTDHAALQGWHDESRLTCEAVCDAIRTQGSRRCPRRAARRADEALWPPQRGPPPAPPRVYGCAYMKGKSPAGSGSAPVGRAGVRPGPGPPRAPRARPADGVEQRRPAAARPPPPGTRLALTPGRPARRPVVVRVEASSPSRLPAAVPRPSLVIGRPIRRRRALGRVGVLGDEVGRDLRGDHLAEVLAALVV